jgi:hypothetical protein
MCALLQYRGWPLLEYAIIAKWTWPEQTWRSEKETIESPEIEISNDQWTSYNTVFPLQLDLRGTRSIHGPERWI